jgi:hypothetical protein
MSINRGIGLSVASSPIQGVASGTTWSSKLKPDHHERLALQEDSIWLTLLEGQVGRHMVGHVMRSERLFGRRGNLISLGRWPFLIATAGVDDESNLSVWP